MIKRNIFRPIVVVLAMMALAAVAAGVGIIYAGKDILAKSIIEDWAYSAGLTRLSIRKMDLGIFSPYVKMEGVIISNPPGFPDGVMLDIPLFYVKYDPAAVLKKQVHIIGLDLNIKSFNMVRNAAGLVNIDSLNVARLKNAREGQAPAGGGGAPLPLKIDRLHIKGARVVYYDHRTTPPKVIELAVNIDDTYNDVTDPYALGEEIAKKAFDGSPLAGMDFSGVLSVVQSGAEAITNAAKGTIGSFGGVDKRAGGILSGTTDTVKNLLQVPAPKRER